RGAPAPPSEMPLQPGDEEEKHKGHALEEKARSLREAAVPVAAGSDEDQPKEEGRAHDERERPVPPAQRRPGGHRHECDRNVDEKTLAWREEKAPQAAPGGHETRVGVDPSHASSRLER